MAEGTGTSNPGGFLQHIKVWAGGGLSCAGLCTFILVFFFPRQQPLPLMPGCAGSPCALLAVGALSVQGNDPFPSWVLLPGGQDQGFGMGWAQVPFLRDCWGIAGSTEAGTHDTDPRNGWWLFSLVYCHWLGAAVVAEGSWAVQHHTQENGMKSTKIRKPIYNIIAVNC